MSDSDISAPAPLQQSLEDNPTRRRMLLELVTGALSFLLIAVPAAIGGLFFLDPLLRKRRAQGSSGGHPATEGFIKLDVSADSIPDNGTPVSVTVVAKAVDDAWNRFRNVPVGSVWLRRSVEGGLTAFNSVCPHLGCSVNYRRSEQDFFCPCHTSAFALDGTKTNEIPPRNMDSLEVLRTSNGEPDPQGQEVWVRFQNFRKATEEKIPV